MIEDVIGSVATTEELLWERWFSLWERVKSGKAASVVAAEVAFEELIARYREPHRVYHTEQHILTCLSTLDKVRHLAIWVDAVALALWFHDAVYDPRAKDNEIKSVELMARVCQELYIPFALVRNATPLILATQHKEKSEEPDTKLMVDIDLSILGEHETIFDKYERGIYREYVENAGVPEETFRLRRAEILSHLLKHPSIYCTEYFQSTYEAQAERNLKRSIAQLANRP